MLLRSGSISLCASRALAALILLLLLRNEVIKRPKQYLVIRKPGGLNSLRIKRHSFQWFKKKKKLHKMCCVLALGSEIEAQERGCSSHISPQSCRMAPGSSHPLCAPCFSVIKTTEQNDNYEHKLWALVRISSKALVCQILLSAPKLPYNFPSVASLFAHTR